MLDDAADLVWAFMIQRELCGFRNWEAVVKDYRIPREVLNRVGQVRRKADQIPRITLPSIRLNEPFPEPVLERSETGQAVKSIHFRKVCLREDCCLRA
jgi:hypothetical protein